MEPALRMPMRNRTVLIAFFSLALLACGDDTTGVGPDRSGPERGIDTGGDTTTTADSSEDTVTQPDATDDLATVDIPDQSDADSGEDAVESDADEDTGADVPEPDTNNEITECAEVVFEADTAFRPADIIWVIDTSESMDEEIAIVRANVNAFVDRIGSSGVDVRMVMVASKEDRTINIEVPFIPFPVPQSYLGVCVPPPLSGADGCPDTDNPPFFLHPDVNVYSTDALTRLMEDAYPEFRSIMRSWARTHIVVVTDDSSEKDPGWFREQTRMVDPPGFSVDYVFHSIVARSSDSCGDGSGDDYEALSIETGGVIQSICASDWTPTFDALLEGVVAGAVLPCAYAIPDPGEGAVINPAQVNVYLTEPGSEPELIINVDGAEGCGPRGGWYYDDPADPSAVYICSNLCGDGVEGSIDIAFGCDTVKE